MRTTTEFRFFCHALRRPQSAEARADLRAAAAAISRWDTILQGARRHQVAALVLDGLRESDAPVPEPVMTELRRMSTLAACHALAQTAALAALTCRFADAGISMLALKGVPLSLRLYGDPAMRSARDIDLLVAPEDADAAAALLAETGHRRIGLDLSGRQKRLYRRWFKDVEYWHPAHGPVDLHHRLTDLAELAPMDFAALWRDSETVSVGGVAVPVLGPRHMACYLCAHGAEHAWQRLRWLADLAMLLRPPGAAERALAAAEASGLIVPMLQAVTLAHEWLGLPASEPVLAAARTDRRVARLNRILAHSYEGESWHATPRRGSSAALLRYSLWQRLYRLSIKPAWPYRWRLLRHELLSPADWAALPLPDRLSWLYPFIRPFGWLIRRSAAGSR
jgi:hypothetical protein